MTDDYIVKVSSDVRGEAFLDIEPQHQKYFARTLACSTELLEDEHTWIIQERVKCLPNQSATDKQTRIVNRMILWYDLQDIDTDNDMPHNWTPDTHGVPKIYDYDFNKEKYFRLPSKCKNRFDPE